MSFRLRLLLLCVTGVLVLRLGSRLVAPVDTVRYYFTDPPSGVALRVCKLAIQFFSTVHGVSLVAVALYCATTFHKTTVNLLVVYFLLMTVRLCRYIAVADELTLVVPHAALTLTTVLFCLGGTLWVSRTRARSLAPAAKVPRLAFWVFVFVGATAMGTGAALCIIPEVIVRWGFELRPSTAAAQAIAPALPFTIATAVAPPPTTAAVLWTVHVPSENTCVRLVDDNEGLVLYVGETKQVLEGTQQRGQGFVVALVCAENSTALSANTSVVWEWNGRLGAIPNARASSCDSMTPVQLPEAATIPVVLAGAVGLDDIVDRVFAEQQRADLHLTRSARQAGFFVSVGGVGMVVMGAVTVFAPFSASRWLLGTCTLYGLGLSVGFLCCVLGGERYQVQVAYWAGWLVPPCALCVTGAWTLRTMSKRPFNLLRDDFAIELGSVPQPPNGEEA